ncbi:MAG: AAA family ATPase [Actinomycetota bacterium]|nr:AAA family ATPase [Actinomycetota bacterium]
MTAHAKVTTIAHTAAGMGQVWYRVTGSTGVSGRQAAYRTGTGQVGIRRVRFVGSGATADLLGFRPGEFVESETDLAIIEESFTGSRLTYGVKTQRSRLARVPASPIRLLADSAMGKAGVRPEQVFVSRDASNWWRALERADARDRSVSFLTAAGVLRALERHGIGVEPDSLHIMLSWHLWKLQHSPVDARGRRGNPPKWIYTDPRPRVGPTHLEHGRMIWARLASESFRREAVGNAGYELTLTLPKSISLFALTGDPGDAAAWFDVMEAGATRALEALMAEAGFCSSGHRGDGENVQIMPADGWAGFIATEISSRAGDPHLHVHCTLPNQLVGADGLVRTMADGGRELIINAPRFASWGQAFVIDEARKRGLIDEAWFDPISWQWQVGGFSEDTITAFSRGHQGVLAELGESEDEQAITARTRSRRDRAAKSRTTAAKSDEQLSWTQLRAIVEERAAGLNLDLDSERATNGSEFPPPGMWEDSTWVTEVLEVACEHDSTASLAKIRALVDLAGAGLPSDERLRITRMVLERGFVRGHESRDLGMKTGGQRWISSRALAEEQWLLATFAGHCLLPAPEEFSQPTKIGLRSASSSNGWLLSEEQAQAVSAIVDGTAPITLIAGVAGSGKTTVLRAARAALESRRSRLLVASTATLAASTAGHESGGSWANLAALRRAIDAGSPPRASLIVIDEASMADVVSVASIARWCMEHNKRLVLQGDPRQLGAVAAGDAFSVLCKHFPDQVVRLTTNQRQRTADGQAIAAALHAGDIEAAWERLSANGSVVVARHREHKLDLLAGLVVEQVAVHGADSVTCDAVTNAEVDDLNVRIHDRLIASGQIDAAKARTYRAASGDTQLGVGTVLRVTKPTPGKDGERLVRGERARVIDAGRDRVRVRFDDGRERSMAPRMLLAHFDYGYAGTTHKVQGQTSAVHIGSLDRNKDRSSLYVTATRGRDGTILVADARDWLDTSEMSKALNWSAGQLDDEVLDRVRAHLTGKVESIDSPTQALTPTWTRPFQSVSGTGMGMSL